MDSRLKVGDAEFEPIQQLAIDQSGKSPRLSISPLDAEYSHAETLLGTRILAMLSYFRQGLQINSAVRQLVEWHFQTSKQPVRMLDFLPAYGQVTRFLAADFGPEQVWVADTNSDSLVFLKAEFAVQTVLAVSKPEAFKPGMQWDCIFVRSFLNSLPEIEFTRWLWKLFSLLSPGGLLIFTACEPASKVSYGFLHQSIIAVTGSLLHTRIPQGMLFTHDLFALTKGQPRTEQIQFQYGPNGSLDVCRWTEPYQMKLSGWAFDPTSGESIERIDLYYNDRFRASGFINHDRPDVATAFAIFQNPATLRSGWDCVANLEGENIRPYQDWLLVKAVSTNGREFVLGLNHPAAIYGFEIMTGWEYDELQGRSHAILPVKRFVDYPVNGHFTPADTLFSGWVACADADSLEHLSLVGRFGNIPYAIVSRPDVYADHHLHSLGFEAKLPPEYFTISDPALRFVTRSGIVLTTFETKVDPVTAI